MKKIEDFKLLKVGYCKHPECMAARGGSFKNKDFPALVGLLKHKEKGYMLYDTGYSENFFKETHTFPEVLYKLITKVYFEKEDCLLGQLEKLNIQSKDINYIIVSHFHADHISGLKAFENAKFIAFRDDYEYLETKNRINKIKNAYLSKLVPENFTKRLIDIEKLDKIKSSLEGFEVEYDLFKDGSLRVIDLKGHTKHQAGLLFEYEDKDYFFIADSAFNIEYLEKNVLPNELAKVITYSWSEYVKTFEKLRNLKDIILIPSHCEKTFRKLK